jgi:hypothetical protein
VEAYAATLKGHVASRGPAKLPISDYGRIRDFGMPYPYIPQGHVRDITTLNCKILTQVTPTRSHPLKKLILYTDTPSFHSSHPTYHATNGIRPHNPQVHPLPFLSTTVLLHNMVLHPTRLFPRLPHPVLSLPIYLHFHRSVLGGCLEDGRAVFLHTPAALELAKAIGEFVDLVELGTWRLTRGRCWILVY